MFYIDLIKVQNDKLKKTLYNSLIFIEIFLFLSPAVFKDFKIKKEIKNSRKAYHALFKHMVKIIDIIAINNIVNVIIVIIIIIVITFVSTIIFTIIITQKVEGSIVMLVV